MRRVLLFVLLSMLLLAACIPVGVADRADGDEAAFCPYVCTNLYNGILKSVYKLDDKQAALLEVFSIGSDEEGLSYTDLLGDTVFIFGGASNEFNTATTVYLYCSMDGPLKKIPMLILANNMEIKYYGNFQEDGLRQWVYEDREDGDTFSTLYFTASYSEENDHCSLLLVRN